MACDGRRERAVLRAGAGAALGAVFCIAVAAWAQTIRIPDFRQSAQPVVLRPGEACNECGRILSVRETYVERKPVVPQVLQGSSNVGSSSGPAERNLVGAVIYLPLGNETTEKPYVGGVGTPEMRERFRDTTYEIAVRMDDGSTRFLQRADGTRFRAGDRVRVAGAADLELVLE